MPLNLNQLDTARLRPMLMWRWNADPTPELMRDHLERIAAANLAGVCIEPLPHDFRPSDFPARMSIEYLSDAFFDTYRTAIGIAAELGLTVWLYDEGGWPSLQACGRLLRGHEHLRGQVLVSESGRYLVERVDRSDPLKPETTERFIAMTHERYRDAVGEHFGKTIEAIFSDELSVSGHVGTDRIPWTDDMPDEFGRRCGYAIDDVLPLLFEGDEAGGAERDRVLAARYDFTRVWNALFVERCIEPQRRWADANGIALAGHMAGEHDLCRHPICFGDYFAVMRRFNTPGVDTIWRQVWPDHVADFSLLAGSARVLSGSPFALSETGAVYGHDITPADLRWICTQQVMRGINRFVIMSMSMSGDVEPGLSIQHPVNPMWEAHEELTAHIAHAGALAAVGTPGPCRAVLYPADSLAAQGPDGPGPFAQRLVSMLHRTVGGCIYIDTDALHDARKESGGWRCGDATIDTLVIAGGSIVNAETMLRVRALADEGLNVRVVGHEPIRVVERYDPASTSPRVSADEQFGVTTPIEFENQIKAMRAAAWIDTGGHAAHISITHRRGEDWDLLLIHNESSGEVTLQTRLPRSGGAMTVNSRLQSFTPVDAQGSITLAGGALAVIGWGDIDWFDTPEPPTHDRQVEITSWSLRPDWRMVTRNGKWARHIATEDGTAIERAELGDWRPILGETFSGQATYISEFTIDGEPRAATLRLGNVMHVAEAQLNGRPLGRRAWSPYDYDATGALVNGVNLLEVSVRNTLADRYWSPEVLDEQREQGRFTIYGHRIAERCPPRKGGGLMGPVTVAYTVR